MARVSRFLRDVPSDPFNPRARSLMHSTLKKSALSNAPTPKVHRSLGSTYSSSLRSCHFAILLPLKMAAKMAPPKWHPKPAAHTAVNTSEKDSATHATNPNDFYSLIHHPRRLRPSLQHVSYSLHHILVLRTLFTLRFSCHRPRNRPSFSRLPKSASCASD